MNRSADALERQQNGFKARGVELDFFKADLIKAELGMPPMGIAEEKLQDLKNTVYVIVHNAWKVDFNQSLECFEAVHIRGVRNLVD